MTHSEGDGDAVHVLDVDSDLGEPPLDSAVGAPRLPRRCHLLVLLRGADGVEFTGVAIAIDLRYRFFETSTSSSSSFALNDRSVATGGALLATLLLMVIGKRWLS